MSWVPAPVAHGLQPAVALACASGTVAGVTASALLMQQLQLGSTLPAGAAVGARPTSRQGSYVPAPVVNPGVQAPAGLVITPTISASLAQLNIRAASSATGMPVFPQPNASAGAWGAPADAQGHRRTHSLVRAQSPDKLSHSLTTFAVPGDAAALQRRAEAPLLPVGDREEEFWRPHSDPLPQASAPMAVAMPSWSSEHAGTGHRFDGSLRSVDHVQPPGAAAATGCGSALVPGRAAGAARPRPRCPSFDEGRAPVFLNVYWQRRVEFDEQGRVSRQLGGDDLTWGKKWLKDVLGIFHVGVEVHGDEYTFGNYHGAGSRQIGSASSGVFRHDPQRPGPHCVFKQAVAMRNTSKARQQVEALCEEFGNSSFSKASYNRIHHNCVDFSRTLTAELGCEDIPAWCHRAAATAKMLGLGGEPPAGVQAAQDGTPDPAGDAACADAAAAQEPNVQAPRVLQMESKRGSSSSGVWGSSVRSSSVKVAVGIGARPLGTAAPPPAAPEVELVGRCVSVFQAAGHWARGQVVAQEAEGRYVVQYENPPRTEPGVLKSRLVPLPEVPRDMTLLAQACRLDDQGAMIDVARRSPYGWPHHGSLTVGTLPAGATTTATLATGGLPTQPQAGGYPVFQLGTSAVLPVATAAPTARTRYAGDAVQLVMPAPVTVQPVMPALLSMSVQPLMPAPMWFGPHAVARGR